MDYDDDDQDRDYDSGPEEYHDSVMELSIDQMQEEQPELHERDGNRVQYQDPDDEEVVLNMRHQIGLRNSQASEGDLTGSRPITAGQPVKMTTYPKPPDGLPGPPKTGNKLRPLYATRGSGQVEATPNLSSIPAVPPIQEQRNRRDTHQHYGRSDEEDSGCEDQRQVRHSTKERSIRSCHGVEETYRLPIASMQCYYGSNVENRPPPPPIFRHTYTCEEYMNWELLSAAIYEVRGSSLGSKQDNYSSANDSRAG